MPIRDNLPIQKHCDFIQTQGFDSLWQEVEGSARPLVYTTINAGVYAGFGNNQMLAAHPDTRETRRFLVGPSQWKLPVCS